MAEQEQDRNEAATPFKLDEARKKGSVPKSLDMNSLFVLLAGAGSLHFFGAGIGADEMRLFSTILSHAHQVSFDVEDMAHMLGGSLRTALLLLAPLFVAVALAGIAANFFQTGPVFSFFALKPDLERVNPIAGFKRLFSLRFLVDAAKTVLKFGILGTVLFMAMKSAMPGLLRTIHLAPAALGQVLVPEADAILFKLLCAYALIALLDGGFSQWDFGRKMRMSRREIREENKRREGDPRVKSRLRELQREAVKRAGSLKRVKEADVLITNPVRLAVAVKYDREAVDAPLVIAKGAGFLAGRMREMARRHHIPVVENRPLARALFARSEIDAAVPLEHYDSIARILVWVYARRASLATGARA